MRVFSGSTADDVWIDAISELSRDGASDVESRNGITTEIRPAVFHITNPRMRWIVSKHPAMNPAFALAEVLWIIAGRDDTAFLEHWFPKYSSFVGGSGTQPGAYGDRLKRKFGFDQLYRAAEVLKNDPDTRQVVLQIWDPDSDLPKRTGEPQSGDIPCNIAGCLKIRDGKLHWLQMMRSNDADRGFPHNVVQFTMLQEILAGWIGVEIGDYTHIADSFHLYTSKRICEARTDIVPLNPGAPLTMNYEVFESELQCIMGWLDQLRVANLKTLDQMIASDPLSVPFENIRLLLTADHLRARGDSGGAEKLVEQIRDDAYRQMWELWISRIGGDQPVAPENMGK